jgi:hypothetical protein
MNEDLKQGVSFDDLEKTNTHTPEEIMTAMIDALIVAVQGKLVSVGAATTVVEITRELLHWAFMKPSTHEAPATLLSIMLAMQGDTVTGKDGKPKLDA